MDLILWRHADAHPIGKSGEFDHLRRLTSKGRKQAGAMAKWLDRHLPESARVLVSPAARAVETADALERRYTIRDELAPGSQPASILAMAQWPTAKHPVVIVGHQPALGQIASLLICGEENELQVRKAGIWWISKRPGDDHPRPILRAAICPEYL